MKLAKNKFKEKVKEKVGRLADRATRAAKPIDDTADNLGATMDKALDLGDKALNAGIDGLGDGLAVVDAKGSEALKGAQDAVSVGRPLKPMVAAAKNIGPSLRLLRPSPLHLDLGVWESMVTNCRVKDMHPGYVVVKLEGDSFETLPATYEADMYVVTAGISYFPTGNRHRHLHYLFFPRYSSAVRETAMLKDLKTDSPVCIRNPNQEVHVLNQYGLSSIDPNIANMIYPIVLSAPGLYEKQELVAAKSKEVSTSASAVGGQKAPAKKPELIFNFMGFVWVS